MRFQTFTRRLLSSILVLLLAATGSTVWAQDKSLRLASEQPVLESSYSLEVAKLRTPAQTNEDGQISVFVQFKGDALATYEGDVAGLPATNPKARGEERLNLRSSDSVRYLNHLRAQRDTFKRNLKSRVPTAKTTHEFDIILNGVSLLVDPDDLGELAKLPNVERILPDKLQKLNTNETPDFIGAKGAWKEDGGQDSAGEGVIVGVIDSGIWPEHPSFSDPDPKGKPYAPPPPPVSGTRNCVFSGGSNPGPAFTCNNKLIGAEVFMNTYWQFQSLLPGEYTSARDDNGHGTHTASTAAGNRNVKASIFNISRGTVSGIAPRAHIIAYKVCGDLGCYQTDSAAAIQKAIQDGVDVINFSISGGANPFADVVELAFLDAYEAGVFVAASAGNSGPSPDTVDHRGPWVTTVAASTSDKHWQTDLVLKASNGDKLKLRGSSITDGITKARPVVLGTSVGTDALCVSPIPANSLNGEIVVCQRGPNRVLKSHNVFQGGGGGMILYNATLLNEFTDNHWVPTVHLEDAAGVKLLDFLSTHTGVTATFERSKERGVKGDVVTVFSSRGGPGQTLGVSKPDVTAPGLQIVAGNTPTPATEAGGPPGELFQSIAGTSMSSPHVAGAAAMLKAIHPEWTPGQIKSALMTTAKYKKVYQPDGKTEATPFDVGSGRIDLKTAWNPGLTFDETAENYLALQNNLWDANYPSLYVPVMPGEITVERTVTNVLGKKGTWKFKVKGPKDLEITVPKKIEVPKDGSVTFSITVDARDVPLGEVRHATLILEGGKNDLHFPITIVRGQPELTLDKTCDPTEFKRNETTTCTITMVNTTFSNAQVSLVDELPKQLKLQPGTVTGGATASGNTVSYNGTLFGAAPPDITIASQPGGSPAGGYLPLQLFGIAPISNIGDESIVNYNIPPFLYGGVTYTRIGITSNGYAVVGGGTAADVDFINQHLPDSTPPNNVLAPFWTDLNPAQGGALRIASLTDGVDSWIVVEWDKVVEYGTTTANSFQIWIGINGVQDITFTYGTLQGVGDQGYLTVGAENSYGNRGQNYYIDGEGTLPEEGDELVVGAVPGSPGETRVITYQAKGDKTGSWQNCAELSSSNIFGVNISCVSGKVNK